MSHHLSPPSPPLRTFPSWRQQGEISSWLQSALCQPVTFLSCFQRVPQVPIPMLPLTYAQEKRLILWICLISTTECLLEVFLCWDAYKKLRAWSSKLICCQIELSNFLLLSCLAVSSLGGGLLPCTGTARAWRPGPSVPFSLVHCYSAKSWSVPLTGLHPSLSLCCALSWDFHDLGSSAEKMSRLDATCFLSNP